MCVFFFITSIVALRCLCLCYIITMFLLTYIKAVLAQVPQLSSLLTFGFSIDLY